MDLRESKGREGALTEGEGRERSERKRGRRESKRERRVGHAATLTTGEQQEPSLQLLQTVMHV